MIEAEDILARATPGRSTLARGAGSGGRPMCTAAEVGYFLAGMRRGDSADAPLSEGPYRILLLRYANGTEDDAVRLRTALITDSPARARDWAMAAGRASACAVAVREFLHARRCATCEGRQVVMQGAQVMVCEACGGTGYRQASGAARAAALGLPATTFRSGPAERYYIDRMRRLVDWEGVGLRRVISKMKRADP